MTPCLWKSIFLFIILCFFPQLAMAYAPTTRQSITTTLSSSSSSTFDEKSFESDRLSKDKKAMDEMKQVSEEEFAKGLRTPWKWKIRKAIWDYMEENDIAQFPRLVHHRIPNFVGSDDAADKLSSLPEFQSANMIKVNPDTPQRRVRHQVLESGKTLLTPQPRLRTGFFQTLKRGSDKISLDVPTEALTSSKGAAKYGTPIDLYEQYTVDLVVVGSSAVCPKTGKRVGKGKSSFGCSVVHHVSLSMPSLHPTSCFHILLKPNRRRIRRA